MVSDPDRDLRRLAKRYRIIFKPPVSSDQWPSIHRNTFEIICKLGKPSFVGYQASIDVRSSEQPWREQTKSRADWLAQRAARLYQQKRNEAGWRFSLENAVFQRFNVEVAWSEFSKLFRTPLTRQTVPNVAQESGDRRLKLVLKSLKM